jgi:cell division protein FtsB
MKCSDFKKHIDDFAEGMAESGLNAEMKEHIETCSSCREEYESIKGIIESLKKNAVSINLNDSQKKGIKEVVLKAPTQKRRDMMWMKRLTYIAAVFMFVSLGLHLIRGVSVNIQPSNNGLSEQAQLEQLKLQVNNLETQKQQLESDKGKLQKENDELKKSIDNLNTQKPENTNDWLMLNSNIGEALIEGKIISIDSINKKIKLEIFKDDNTPNIDPNITIPDGIYIFTQIDGKKDKYQFKAGSINDLNVGNHISIHYLSKSKSARAILLWK